MKAIIAELKRRGVLKVGTVYVVAAWLILQVVDVAFPAFQLPPWTITFVASLLAIGFPVTLIMAWAFELTPDGIRRSDKISTDEAARGARTIDYVIIGVLAAAVLFFAWDKFFLSDETGQNISFIAEDLRSIAVLPFANVSGDPLNEPFTVGIHDDLLTHVSKISSIKTISRTSVLRYRNTDKTVPEIARELAVATILEGGVQRVGDRVRINVQLIDASTDEHIWAETYDRELTAANIFAIQSEIARAIAESLEATLSPHEARRLDTVPTRNLDAYEAYLLGKQRMVKRTLRDLNKAAEYFQQAVQLDPEYALAWVGLANAYTLLGAYGGLTNDEVIEHAQPALDRALALDDELAEVHAAIGLFNAQFDRNEAAEAAYLKAMELDPNDATAYHWYAELLKTDMGRPDLAVKYFKKALELDPLHPIKNASFGTALAMLGRFEDAFEYNNRASEIDMAVPGAYWGNATMYWAVHGDMIKATTLLYQVRRLDPKSPGYTGFLSLAYLDMSNQETAAEFAEDAVRLGPDDFLGNFAALYVASKECEGTRAAEIARRIIDINPIGQLYGNSGDVLHALGICTPDAPAENARMDLYRQVFPDLVSGGPPEIHRANYRAAIDVAGILVRQGESERARELLAASETALEALPRLGWFGYGVADAEILALQGKQDEAVAAVQMAFKDGWRLRWWTLERNPNLRDIHDRPEIREIFEAISKEMNAQLVDLREQIANDPLMNAPP